MADWPTISAGSILLLETGAYSDFSYTGPFKVLRDIDPAEALAEFREQDTSARNWRAGARFTAWLATSGFIEDYPITVWNLGEYSLDPDPPVLSEGGIDR